MAWPAHGGGGIGRHDLADDQPIEQVAPRRQAQLAGRCGARLRELLDIGGDMHALDGGDVGDAARRQPVEEFLRRAHRRAACWGCGYWR